MKGCKELLDEEHFDVLLCNFCTSSAGVRLMQGRSLQVPLGEIGVGCG